ncbi:hypothetical protein OAJ70_04540 [Pelagibacteraceae bacterium]|nr:hypothetical protein [Pelagibacteraceae bacterium]
MKIILTLFILLFSSSVFSNEELFGSWKSDEGIRIDIIDGFKPNIGPVIYWEDDELSEVRTWKINPNNEELSISWSSGNFDISDNGNLMNWSNQIWTKIENIEMKNVIDVKQDPDAFINELTNYKWSSNSNKSDIKEFTKTFTSSEGIFSEFDNNNDLISISSWGIASGVMKIGDYDLYIEAKISDKFLLGVDDDDDFLVLYKGDVKKISERISLKDSREQFLSSLTTGAWLQKGGWGSDTVFRYRPVEGDLKGRVFREQDNKLISTEVWEYSPSTGSFLQSYIEYTAGLNIGEIVVFVDKNGKQYPYYRDKSVEMKSFTLNDVKNIPITERLKDEISNTLNKQMSVGGGNDFTLFEFNEDNRTGYFHEWVSSPFQITGQTLTIGEYDQFEKLYLVEDYLLFDDTIGRKIDTRESRMKPKTNDEAKKDSIDAKQTLEEETTSSLKIKIDLKDGSSTTIPIPVSSLNDLQSISIITN